ncbi:MAG: response regulator [bacterium]
MEPHASSLSDSSNGAAQKAKQTILVVDDEANLRKILKFHLEASGYRVLTAEDGMEGIEVAKREQPTLVLLDLMMPKMSGSDVVRELKVEPTTRFIPVIILTAKTGNEEKIRQLENGAQDYITKPFSLSEVLARVKSVIAWGQSQRQANPLTGLPGNLSIEEELTKRVLGKEPFALLYADLDHFKPYNDYYGYHRGDHVIFTLSRMLLTGTREMGNRFDFVGHVGGDDFVIVSTPEKADAIGQRLVNDFRILAPSFYDAADIDRGYIEVKSRMGEPKKFALLSLTVACITNETREIHHVVEASDIAAELKRYGKGVPGCVFVKERRGQIWYAEGYEEIRELVGGELRGR